MTQVIEAIYENGVLRPTEPLEGIREHERVTLSVSAPRATKPSILDCFGIMPDEDAEEMRRIIEAEFDQIDPDEWK